MIWAKWRYSVKVFYWEYVRKKGIFVINWVIEIRVLNASKTQTGVKIEWKIRYKCAFNALWTHKNFKIFFNSFSSITSEFKTRISITRILSCKNSNGNFMKMIFIIFSYMGSFKPRIFKLKIIKSELFQSRDSKGKFYI